MSERQKLWILLLLLAVSIALAVYISHADTSSLVP
jgi:hypothetical protein